jgi:cell division protein FtsB|tara:strand:- start:155 stop:355 length:201 start_codon:yes stop_codon:yes gene_type:complete
MERTVSQEEHFVLISYYQNIIKTEQDKNQKLEKENKFLTKSNQDLENKKENLQAKLDVSYNNLIQV